MLGYYLHSFYYLRIRLMTYKKMFLLYSRIIKKLVDDVANTELYRMNNNCLRNIVKIQIVFHLVTRKKLLSVNCHFRSIIFFYLREIINP